MGFDGHILEVLCVLPSTSGSRSSGMNSSQYQYFYVTPFVSKKHLTHTIFPFPQNQQMLKSKQTSETFLQWTRRSKERSGTATTSTERGLEPFPQNRCQALPGCSCGQCAGHRSRNTQRRQPRRWPAVSNEVRLPTWKKGDFSNKTGELSTIDEDIEWVVQSMKTYGNYSCNYNYHSKPSEMGTMFTNLAKEINIHVFSGKSCLLPTVSDFSYSGSIFILRQRVWI